MCCQVTSRSSHRKFFGDLNSGAKKMFKSSKQRPHRTNARITPQPLSMNPTYCILDLRLTTKIHSTSRYLITSRHISVMRCHDKFS